MEERTRRWRFVGAKVFFCLYFLCLWCTVCLSRCYIWPWFGLQAVVWSLQAPEQDPYLDYKLLAATVLDKKQTSLTSCVWKCLKDFFYSTFWSLKWFLTCPIWLNKSWWSSNTSVWPPAVLKCKEVSISYWQVVKLWDGWLSHWAAARGRM